MKRREFISTGAAIGTGLVLSSTFADKTYADETKPQTLCRIALFGCGRQGRTLINAGLKISGLKFAAVCDIQPSLLRSAKLYLEAEDVETNAYADYRDLLDKEKDSIDAVIITSPDFVHCEHTIAALKAGLHVYCESPMATNAADAKSMIQTAKETGRFLQIGFERRSDPRYRHAVERFLRDDDSRELLLGTVTHFETQAHRRVHSELIWTQRDTLPVELLTRYGYTSMTEYRNWRHYQRYGGGSCITYLAQQLDVMEWFFGIRPAKIQAMGGLDYYKFGDCMDNISAILSYPFPQRTVRSTSRVWTTTSGGGTLPFEHVYGVNGSLQTSLSDELFRLHAEPGFAKWSEFVRRGDMRKERVAKDDEDPNLISVRETGNVVPYILPITRPDSIFRLHLENFVDAVAGKTPLHCSGADAFAAHVIAWKIAEAAKNNGAAELSEEMFVL
ncbi:MAG: Gfo/Idh/MocA family oxidoreductase [Planctomycetaceae bacterium]|nr:Gfo/Idh/MocA family oxidoreductase [Planctomycetaceae bacterium]